MSWYFTDNSNSFIHIFKYLHFLKTLVSLVVVRLLNFDCNLTSWLSAISYSIYTCMAQLTSYVYEITKLILDDKYFVCVLT